MTRARKRDRTPDETSTAPVEPADWVKPVELIDLLERRTERRKRPEAPTSSPFYDAEFVASHHRMRIKRPTD